MGSLRLLDLGLPSPYMAGSWGHVLSCSAVLILIGCSHHNVNTYEAYSSSGLRTAAQGAEPASLDIPIEVDGLPAQHPPRVSQHAVDDDPSEPFSPNYGQHLPVGAVQATPLRARHIWRKQMSSARVKAIISRAVAEHELRQQEAETRRF